MNSGVSVRDPELLEFRKVLKLTACPSVFFTGIELHHVPL